MKSTRSRTGIGNLLLALGAALLLVTGCAVVEETPQTQTTYTDAGYRGQVPSGTIRDLDARYPDGYYTESRRDVPEGERVSIGIVLFEGSDAALARQITDVFSTTIIQSGQFRVVEREKVDKLAAEMELGQSGLVAPATARQAGGMTGMKLMLTGSITDSGGRQRIDVKAVDTETGEAVLGEKMDGVVDADSAGFLARRVVNSLSERYYGAN